MTAPRTGNLVPPRSPAPSATVLRARRVMEAALDELGPRLLAITGAVISTAKADGTPVTSADREADDYLGAVIAEAFPGHGVLSEERETPAPTTDWCWIVDPIDGTSNFIAGLPYWCVSVALAFEGEVVLGIVDAPPVAQRVVAIRGEGTWRDGQVTHVGGAVDWRDRRNRHMPVMLTTGTAKRARGAGLALNARVMGSTALDLAAVAGGAAVASVALVPRIWDIAAGSLLVHEAGGAVETLRGEPLLPLRPGVAYHRRSAATAAGPTAEYVRDIAAGLLPHGF